MTTLKLPYREIARLLLDRPEHKELAERYLALRKRVKTLRNGDGIELNNPLAGGWWTLPLSVAGEPSSVVVRAERMKLDGIPIALKDEEGGVGIETVQNDVFQRTGEHLTLFSILSLYEEMILGKAKIRDEIRKCKEELTVLEKQLMDALIAIDFDQVGRKLTAFPPASILVAAVSVAQLNAAAKGRDWRSLVIAFHNGTLRVNGIKVAVGCGKGGGSGVIRTRDIQYLLSQCQPMDAIELDFRDSTWIATVHQPGGFSWGGEEFRYYEE